MPGAAGSPGAYALIGMGAVFAGSARAPITAVVILFELTGEYSIILPLMTAVVLATGVSHLLTGDSIYSLKLRRRGIDLDAPEPSVLDRTSVAVVMEPVAGTLDTTTRLSTAADALVRAPHGQLPVLDGDGRYIGIVTAHAVADALADAEHDDAVVGSLVESPTAVRDSDTVADALPALQSTPGAIPVLDAELRLVGWLSHQRVLAAVHGPSGVDAVRATDG